MQSPFNIKTIRNEIDLINEQIIIGLKKRSNFPLNLKTFNQAPKEGIEKEIIESYKKILSKICENREDESTYNASMKIDAEHILLYKKRVIILGEQVAEYKLSQNPSLSNLNKTKEIEKQLIVPQREKELISNAVKLSEKYKIKNIDSVKSFIKDIIKLNTKVQVQKILNMNKKEIPFNN